MKRLPVFEGYTVDVRLKQFRKVKGESIEFIDFDSVKTLGSFFVIKISLSRKRFKETYPSWNNHPLSPSGQFSPKSPVKLVPGITSTFFLPL